MSNLRKLISELNDLCGRLDEDYNINCGGCCFVAYLMMKHFEKLGIHPTFVIESNEDDVDGDEFLNNVKSRHPQSWALGNHTCHHYFVHIPEVDQYVNSGEFCEDCLYKYKGLSSKDVHWIYQTGDWNNDYERKDSPMVGRLITQVFQKYEDLYKE